MVDVSFKAMGTDVQIVIHPTITDTTDDFGQAIKDARDKILELEALLSRFRSESDISRLNRKPGQWVDVNPNTLKILAIAKEAYLRTKGFFNPCLGNVLENIGYNVSFDDMNTNGSTPNLIFQVPFILPMRCPYELNEKSCQVFLEPNFKIDLGGIAKGWIVEQASDVLKKHGITQFLCNAGGDMVCRGKNGRSPWCIGIANPTNPDKILMNLDIANLCVATSGTYRRKWSYSGKPVHHIIDPFLGSPVRSEIVSCTVVHENLVEAEVFAKVGLILGVTDGEKWMRKQGVQGWVMVKDSGEVIHSWN